MSKKQRVVCILFGGWSVAVIFLILGLNKYISNTTTVFNGYNCAGILLIGISLLVAGLVRKCGQKTGRI